MINKNKKNKKIIITVATICATLCFVAIIFFVVASNIIVEECASPCRHRFDPNKPFSEQIYCGLSCDKITLLDRILGND